MVNSMQISKYITFVSFAKFNLWDTKRYTSKLISSTFPIVSLDSCILEQSKKYKIFEDLETDFGILGVNNKEGIFDAYTQKGKEINQPYKKMETGWLAYNPYRINVGSIGIKLKEHQNNYISPAYVVFSCKENLLPEFLFFLFKTTIFNTVINESTTGSVRQNLTFETLKNLQIPLPTIEEQNRIVTSYNAKLQLAQQQEDKAKTLENEIEKYLFEELGVEIKEKANKNKVFQLIKFSEIQRWDTLFLLGNLPNMNSSYKLTKFSDVIKYFNKGENGKTIRIDSPKFPKDDFRYIGMEHIEKETGNLLDMPEVKGKEIKSQTLRVPKDFFIYGKLRPYLNKYWINTTDFDNIICSSEFFVFDINDNLDKLFFKYILSSKIIQNQISDKTSGARMPRINEDIFFNLQFPLPPIEKQKEISNHINSIKVQIKELNVLSATNKEVAIVEFEKEIFN
jgi:type I restriction enzyme, S subunit